jgi:hypothetical protein
MVFFTKDIIKQQDEQNEFDKCNFIKELKTRYPHYHLIIPPEGIEPYDLLLIRNVNKETKDIIGAFHHERIRQELLQQVYAIKLLSGTSLDITKIVIQEDLDRISTYTRKFIIVNSLAMIFKILEDDE